MGSVALVTKNRGPLYRKHDFACCGGVSAAAGVTAVTIALRYGVAFLLLVRDRKPKSRSNDRNPQIPGPRPQINLKNQTSNLRKRDRQRSHNVIRQVPDNLSFL